MPARGPSRVMARLGRPAGGPVKADRNRTNRERGGSSRAHADGSPAAAEPRMASPPCGRSCASAASPPCVIGWDWGGSGECPGGDGPRTRSSRKTLLLQTLAGCARCSNDLGRRAAGRPHPAAATGLAKAESGPSGRQRQHPGLPHYFWAKGGLRAGDAPESYAPIGTGSAVAAPWPARRRPAGSIRP